MSGGRCSRRCVSRFAKGSLALVVASLFLSSTAAAFEAFEGRVQAHGFFSSQMRALNADYSEDWDVSQWYMVFNLELELDLIQDRVGPIDLMSAFVRAEVRYDCIYSRGCGMFRSMNAYGDRSKSLPRRLMDQDRVRNSGRIRINNDPDLPDQYRNFVLGRGTNTDPLLPINDPVLALFANGSGGDGFSPRETCDIGELCNYFAGGNQAPSTWPDDDTPYTAIAQAGDYEDFVFVAPKNASGLGPWLPKNFFKSNATGAPVGNPFDDRAASYALQASGYNGYLTSVNDFAPLFDASGQPLDEMGMTGPTADARLTAVLDAGTNGEDMNGNGTLDPGEDLNGNMALDQGGLQLSGGGALPYRPAPLRREAGIGIGQAQSAAEAQGMFIPSYPLARLREGGDLKRLESDYNFNENERAWNRGASQKDEKELKEAYLDIETFDNRLWVRVGKQQIVWGKTELFRTTDQFNPTDAALASLPSLEASRIALWSLRAVWSFYEVGPLDDVRLEVAFNFDDYQQTDIGACGEPYAPNITCQLTFGGFAHGVFGFGIAGVEKPPSPWQSLKGWEVGARVEWRYDRFSFALMDFYGYDDLPTIKNITTYTRNVDPWSGRPREIFSTLVTRDPGGDIEQVGTQGACMTGLESACLNPLKLVDSTGTGIVDADLDMDGTIDGIPYSVDLGTGAVTVVGDGNFDAGPESEALTKGAVAQQVYAYTCATTVGFSSLDRSACSLNIFGSSGVFQNVDLGGGLVIPITVAQSIGGILAGTPALTEGLAATFGGFVPPLVSLDPGSQDLANPTMNGGVTCRDFAFAFNPLAPAGQPCGGEGSSVVTIASPAQDSLGGTLSPEQEALLGCGPFWGTQCDDSGIDLLNTEGSALFQSWPGVEGTVQNGDIFQPWFTNTKVTSPVTGDTVFAQQPGTRGWYFDQTRKHAVGPVCTTANFGGAIYEFTGDDLEDDRANGNQAILPGCRRKWKADPDLQEFAGNNQLLALNLYGQDRTCAKERVRELNGGPAVSAGCAGLGDFNSPRVDPRSWELGKDGEPDGLGLVQAYTSVVTGNTLITPPPRDIVLNGTTMTQLVVPDFFYTPTANADGMGNSTFQAANVAAFPGATFRHGLGLAFDNCDQAALQTITTSVAEAGGDARFIPCGNGGHPMTGQPWSSEMAAVSWNMLVLLVSQDLNEPFADAIAARDASGSPLTDYDVARQVWLDPDSCSIVQPALCDTFRTLQGAIGLQRNVRKAGGNGTHGRRTFAWQSGGEAILTYEKRNVLGFSADFAEDVTKANFSLEFTWIEGVPVADRNQYDDLASADDFNLTLSVDRPTFINFLNSNRTFFFNWQFFSRYREGWRKGFTDEGAWSFLTTFAVSTGYFQDRLSPSIVNVYDITTQSGAILTSISYRFTQNFSAAMGLAYFYGKPDQIDEPIAGIAPAGNRSTAAQDDIYKSRREGGLAIVRDRDEIWASLRYTF